ncbi:type IV secretory system conjugative DNA transfer family protein [bacterium]|nr:type IV secretory system conjugative DNA transfer family protein [bacterium]
MLIFAPTGSGKGVSLLIPTLLTYNGPSIVIDVKGENYQVTAERRRQMGQKVFVIDPFNVVTQNPDKFNPFDIASLSGSAIDVDAEMIAGMLSTGKASTDSFWNDTAAPFLAGVITYALATRVTSNRNLIAVQKILRSDDVDGALARVLDNDGAIHRFAREEIAAYLQITSDRTRPCVLSTVRTYLRALCSDAMQTSLAMSSFNWQELIAGGPMTLYFVIPPSRLESHSAIIRLWIGTLMLALSYREKQTEPRTLFLLDEAAQLGELDILKQFFSLMRGYGVQVMAFYQNLAQLKGIFPNDWETILDNAGAIATFGFNNFKMATAWSEYFNIAPEELARMPRTDMAVLTPRDGSQILRRSNYLVDEDFRGLFRPNPRFSR